MATKLNSITTQYRSFVNDQVLTADQLNDLIQYFEVQDRLSRVYLNGVGIACGFNVTVTDSKEIIVSQGCGITTDGDLIKFQQPDTLKTISKIDIQEVKFSLARDFKDTNVMYEPFLRITGKDQIKLYELLPDSTAKNTDNFEVGSIPGLLNMVAVLYLEEFPKQPELCTAIDCNNQGIEKISRLKVLLCSEDDARHINIFDSIYTKHSFLSAYLKLPDVAVPRVLLTNASAASQSNLQKSFQTAISANNILRDLKEGITILFDKFKGFLNLPATITSEIINQWIKINLEFTIQAIPFDVQYRYDLLKDLVDTYNEIKELLLQLESECCPDIKSFPKHLMIGRLTASLDNETFRHSFYKSPASENGDQNTTKFNSLANRFFLMLSKYTTKADEVKITPSKTMVSLSNRSIPYYFTVDDKLIDSWDYSKTCRLMQKNNLCYYTTYLSPLSHIQSPLRFNLDAFNFFRIEGYLEISSTQAEPQLSNQRISSGLDFDYITFDIENDQTELQIFINKNNSLEHLAGVPKGGTFILLKKANFVIADFAMSHKYTVATESDVCCKISECSYPWISSLRYLNNLSRSLKGTQSKTKQMPKYYRLYILKYAINDIDLISQPVEIRIPLIEVFSRRLHVVIEKLNEQFPTGLVFDFDQQKKQLKIKKLKDDTFIFNVKDITLSNDSPVYTYTEMGYLRNGKVLNAKGITCVDVKMLNKNFYQKLHDRFNPKNKDDDFGSYNNKWSKWNSLADQLKTNPLFKDGVKRFGTKLENLPKEIQLELSQIKADIIQNNAKAKVYLSGDWASGTWVDSKMLEHYQANLKNTHDDIVLFIKLRESLHQKLGKSKFDIFVATVTEEQLKALQIKYMNKANFYLGKAEEKKYIEL